MFEHVIVGVDGRSGGRDAIALARLLVAPRSGRLALAHIQVLTPVDASSAAYADAERNPSQLLLEQERTASAVDAELVTLVASSVGRGLHSMCESEGADLLVVGSSHRGFAGRVLVGNDTRASLNGASCAVAVAPLHYAEQRPQRIASVGVGYDGGEESVAALALARDVAAEHGAALRALQVVQIPSLSAAGIAGSAWGDMLTSLLADAREAVQSLDGVQGEAVLGLAGEELSSFAAHVDLLVVGSRGYGPLRRLMLGSTSEHLAGHARSPLLVLPRAAADRPAPTATASGD